MNKIINIKSMDDFKLEIQYSDNYSFAIDIKPFIKRRISNKLSDINYFRTVKIDEFGGICWENGFDFCPNYLRKIAEKI